jgi:hypothetical protein
MLAETIVKDAFFLVVARMPISTLIQGGSIKIKEAGSIKPYTRNIVGRPCVLLSAPSVNPSTISTTQESDT